MEAVSMVRGWSCALDHLAVVVGYEVGDAREGTIAYLRKL